MSARVCLVGNALRFPAGGGHVWEYLNWALSLRAAGCEVVWLEWAEPGTPPDKVIARVRSLRARLEPYGFADSPSVAYWGGDPVPAANGTEVPGLAAAEGTDLLLSLDFRPRARVPGCRRAALVDLDPGLLQVWAARGWLDVGGYDAYFTVGETVGRPEARFPDLGIEWHYTPSAVALDRWPVRAAPEGAPFTTVTNWVTGDEWMQDGDEWYSNDKRDGFLPYLSLPRRTGHPLEIALSAADANGERAALVELGWRLRDVFAVAGTPWDYQRYVRRSAGEFSGAKPSCARLENAWISNRTLCYLASGKPAVVQHTGPSRFLPDAAGLLRVRDVDEAARALDRVTADYAEHARLARALVEDHFEGRRVATRLLERALA